jgi:phosphoadenosine phosphosulfate reductase
MSIQIAPATRVWQAGELQRLSDEFENSTPQEILRWSLLNFRDKLTMATAFGAEGCVLIHMLAQLRDETGITPDIFNLDTGYQFQETLELRDALQEKYGLPIRFVRSEESVRQMENRFGGPIYASNPEHCCYVRKVVPLREAVKGFDAWISAIRRDQTPERAVQPIIGFEPKFPGLVKINPLANWSRDQVWDFIKENGVPYNPLHDQGYPSIGCYPCTRPVGEGDDERAGRWAGLEKRECGLHLGANGKLQRASATD